MTDPKQLRRKAARYRRAAAIRTEGATETDRQLIVLAESLEEEAARLERAAGLSDEDPPGS